MMGVKLREGGLISQVLRPYEPGQILLMPASLQDVDEEEDRHYGNAKRDDELPREMAFRESRLRKMGKAKAALEAEGKGTPREAGAVQHRLVTPGGICRCRLPYPHRHLDIFGELAYPTSVYYVRVLTNSEHR